MMKSLLIILDLSYAATCYGFSLFFTRKHLLESFFSIEEEGQMHYICINFFLLFLIYSH